MKWLRTRSRASFSLLAALAVAGPASCPERSPEIVCVNIKKYSTMTVQQFAVEAEKVKREYPTVTQFLADYRSLRKALETCRTGKTA